VRCLGLGARNTLRLEGKLAALRSRNFGHDQRVGSRLERWCQMENPDFIGKAALEKARNEGLKRTLSASKWSIAASRAMAIRF